MAVYFIKYTSTFVGVLHDIIIESNYILNLYNSLLYD